MASTEELEELVAEQSAQLGQMNRPTSFMKDDDDFDDLTTVNVAASKRPSEGLPMTAEEVKKEEEDVAELERKKQTLEERVSGMEKDLGGLMR